MLEAGYAAPELAGRANKLAELIVKDIIEEIQPVTVGNRCVLTTFDKGIADCVKEEISIKIKKLYL